MLKVYLAGPIEGYTYDEANDWRLVAQTYLAQFSIAGYNPLRSKELLKRGNQVITVEQYKEVLASDKGLTTRDHYDVRTCDLMLVNFAGATHRGLGTPVEFGWASAYQKPIVTVLPEGNPFDHPMIRHLSGFVLPTLEEALEIVPAILLP